MCGGDSVCSHGVGTAAFACACAEGWSGGGDNAVCADDNECDGVDCGGESVCVNGAAKYTCNCAAGWVGGGDSTVCDQCSEGTYESAGACVDCPAGKFNIEKGASAENDCTLCAPRTFNPSPGATTSTACQACAHCYATDAERTHCMTPRDADCAVTEWSLWGVCDATCQEGRSHRTRSVTASHWNAGAICPVLAQQRQCMDRVCECASVTCSYETHDCSEYLDHVSAVDHTNKLVSTAYAPAGISGMGTRRRLLDDTHDLAKTCAAETSVRVHHGSNGSADADVTLGHHCRHSTDTAIGCKCRCHSMYKQDAGYNPKTTDKFEYSIPVLQDAADGIVNSLP